MSVHDFKLELAALINKHSLENGSDTPDWILATYLVHCLDVFDKALGSRERWYSRPLRRDRPGTPGDAPTPANEPSET